MCWKYDKRGVPHLKEHKWERVDTPDRWEWEEQDCRYGSPDESSAYPKRHWRADATLYAAD